MKPDADIRTPDETPEAAGHPNALLLAGKVLLSLALAFAILNAFCFIYSNTPPHAQSTSGATDFSRPANAFYSRWTEGGSLGRTNNEGLYNLFDYEEGMELDGIILGSSHLEGTYVPLEESVASRLNGMAGGNRVYNLGMASHFFLQCAQNLGAALGRYRPKKFAAIHVDGLAFSAGDLELAAAGEFPELKSYSSGAMALAERMPYARMLYDNWKRELDDMSGGLFAIPANEPDENGAVELPAADDARNTQLLGELLAKLGEEASSHGAQLVIFYNPVISFSDSGELVFSDDDAYVERFSGLCAESGIHFIDMREAYTRAYEEDHILPRGFWNSSVGYGHLNKYGHAMVAEELSRFLED